MAALLTRHPILLIVWLLYWLLGIGALVFSLLAAVRSFRRCGDDHGWHLVCLVAAVLLNTGCAFMAECVWELPLIRDVARIMGLLAGTAVVWHLPRFINSRPELCLRAGVNRFFSLGSALMFLHYLASAAWFYATRYDGSLDYFGGYRYLPALSLFLLEFAAISYGLLAILSVRQPGPDLARLKRMTVLLLGLTPLLLVFDLLRYMFPALWRPLPEERLFVLPALVLVMAWHLASYATGRLADQPISPIPATGIEALLSRREFEVAGFLLDGATYKEVATNLHISLPTVQTHVRNIYRKCGVNSRLALQRLKAERPWLL